MTFIVATDFIERAHLTEELEKLTLKNLIDQCKSDGVDLATIERAMDSHSDPIPDLIQSCIEVASGGTVDLGGQEQSKDLKHRALDRKGTRIAGTARHASNPPSGALPPRKRYWKNFDPSEGEHEFRVGSRVTGESIK
jgi:hypothetical protein